MFSENRAYLNAFFRTYLVGANFNTRGLQNVGLAFAMDPGLKMLHREKKDLRQARKRYFRLYNTHPYWTPFLIGYFLFLERKIAQGTLPPKSLGRIRRTTTYTLSAIGDSVFGGSLVILWSLATICLLLYGQVEMAFAGLAVALTGLHAFKAYTFWRGLNSGLTFLQQIKEWDLINWGERIKVFNALLVLLIWYRIFPYQDMPWVFWVWAASLAALAWIAERTLLFRETLMVGAGIVCLFWPMLEGLWQMVAQ